MSVIGAHFVPPSKIAFVGDRSETCPYTFSPVVGGVPQGHDDSSLFNGDWEIKRLEIGCGY